MVSVSHFLPILAASDDDPGKIIIAVIAVAFWVIGGIASAMKKKRPAEEEQILTPPPVREIRRPVSQPPPLPRQVSISRPRPSSAIPTHTKPVLRRPTAVRKKAPVKRPAPQQPPPVITAPAGDIITSRAPAASALPPRSFAKSIAQSLAPKNLRRQFILTEIFQPPVTLRDENR